MFAVWLKSFPGETEHTMHRVVRKQRRPLSDEEIDHLLHRVLAGEEQLIRVFPEDGYAENLVKEFALHGATAEMKETDEPAY